jgi:hypothetical protein
MNKFIYKLILKWRIYRICRMADNQLKKLIKDGK